MRPSPFLAFVVLLVVGCVAPAAVPDDALRQTGGWTLDCSLGSFEPGPWAQECAVRASHTPGSKTETWIGINPADPRNVIVGAKDQREESSAGCVWNGLAVTHDGGRSWVDVTIGGDYADRRPGDPWFGYACNTDPMFAFSADGAVHYGVEVYHFGQRDYEGYQMGIGGSTARLGWKVLLATSRDGGLTWPEVIPYQEDLVTVTDYSRMTVSPRTGSILEAINHFAGGFTCHVLASRDGGRTADVPRVVTPKEAPMQAVCRGLASAPDGTVVLGFAASGSEGRRQHVFARSTDDGRSFDDSSHGFDSVPIPSPFNNTEFRTGTAFEIAYDLTGGSRSGTLYALYGDAEGGNADVLLRASRDHGVTWSDPVRVGTDPAGHDQFNGNLAVAGDGSVHVFFMDRKLDPANRLIDITHALSLDGGATWFEQRVTTRSFDGDLGRHQSGAPFIGDYMGVAAVGDEVWVGYPDSSGGNVPVIAAARVFRQPADARST